MCQFGGFFTMIYAYYQYAWATFEYPPMVPREFPHVRLPLIRFLNSIFMLSDHALVVLSIVIGRTLGRQRR